MNLIDKIITEWSWRTTKGYPDINSQEDLDILKEILGEELYEAAFKQLSFYDLAKYGGPRLKVLHDKIQKGETFIGTGEQEYKLSFAKDEYAELFANQDIDGIKQVSGNRTNSFPFFEDESGKTVTISDLLKAPEFGGKGSGSGTTKEDFALSAINQALQELGSIDVRLSADGPLYKDIVKATTVKGTPKADFTLDTEQGPVVFISHKDGAKATDFQQYSGFSGMEENDEVKSFVEAVREASGGELTPGMRFRRPIKGDEIKLKAVYGVAQSTSDFGINNCQVILQGPVKFVSQSDGTYLVEANHKVLNPALPLDTYEPVFCVTFRRDRRNMGIVNARFGVYPAAYQPGATEI